MHKQHMDVEWELLVVDSDEQTACEMEHVVASYMPGSSVRRLEDLSALAPCLLDRGESCPTLVLCKIDTQNIMDVFPLMHTIRNTLANVFVIAYTHLVDASLTLLLHEHGVSNVVPLLPDGQSGLMLGASLLQADRRYRASTQAETTGTVESEIVAAVDRVAIHSTESPHKAAAPATPVLLVETPTHVSAERPRSTRRFSRSTMKDLLAKFTKRLGFNTQHVQRDDAAEAVVKCEKAREDSARKLCLSDSGSCNTAAGAVITAREDSALGFSYSPSTKAASSHSNVTSTIGHNLNF